MPTATQDRSVESPLQNVWRLLGALFRSAACSDLAILIALALAVVLLHTVVNGQYGFHRDELLTYTNATHLEWGYDVYPPLTALLARADLELFGTSLRGFRMAAAVAHGLVVLLAGLAARELGGKREAQIVTASSIAIMGGLMVHGSFLSYSSFDFVGWILVAYCVIRPLKSDDPRWCVAVGAAIALGMMAKYSMAFFALGVLGGMLLTPVRRYFASRWFWLGVAVAAIVMLPNIIWQIRRDLVSLDYLRTIHSRGMGRGWTDYFLLNQLWKNTNPMTVPLWLGGLWYVFGTIEGRRYRPLGWMYVITLLLLFLARGRDYYLAPAYPMLLALGAVWGERRISTLNARSAMSIRGTAWWSIATAGLCTIAVTLPIAPLGSAWWRFANHVNGGNFDMQVGWPDMVQQVAHIRDSLPSQERTRVGIWAGDEGEAGAVNLYGPAYQLPRAISGMNSNWYRGYGDPPPEALIILGEHRDFAGYNFASCTLAGRITNRYGISNSSVAGWDEIFVCRQLRWPWPEFWSHLHSYG